MKLSELSTNEAADILCQLTPYLNNIITDESLIETIGKAINREGLTKVGLAMAALNRISDCIPILFGTHKDDVFGIIAIVNKKSIKDIAEQSLKETKDQLKEILQDPDLLDFFTMFGWQAKSA